MNANSTIKLGFDYFFIQQFMAGLGIAVRIFVLFAFLLRRSQFMLALRNVFRNKHRILITLFAVISAMCGSVLMSMVESIAVWNRPVRQAIPYGQQKKSGSALPSLNSLKR